MKHLYIYSVILFLLVLSSCSQSNLDMNTKIYELSLKVDSLSLKVNELAKQNNDLEIELSWLENEIGDISKLKQAKMNAPLSLSKPASTPVSTPKVKAPDQTVADGQCQAITNSGKRCSRTALKGSKYCYQHKQIYEPDLPAKK